MSRAGLAKLLRQLADRLTMSEPAASSKPSAEKDDAATAYVKETREAMQAMREHLRRMAAALGAGATAVLAGLGYSQIHQLFPLPEDLGTAHRVGRHSLLAYLGYNPVPWKFWLAVIAAFGVVAAPVGAAWLAGRFFRAQRRIPIDAEGLHGARSTEEDELARKVFDDSARDEEAESLLALELRSKRFRHIAQGLSEEARKQWEAKADYLDSVVEMAEAEAAATVLERRSEEVFSGRRTKAALALAVAGFIALFGAADVAKGHRDLVALRSTCADAVSKGSTDACDPVSSQQREAVALAKEVVKARTEEERIKAAANAEKLAPGAQTLYKKVLACTKLLTVKPAFKSASEGVKTAAIKACAHLG